MAATSTLTQKGQVTIPASIRRELGLETGDSLQFHCDGDRIVVEAVTRDVGASFGLVRAQRGASLDDMDAAIQEGAGR